MRSEGWSEVRLADVLVQARRRVTVESGRGYRLLGVRWYADGPFHRETVTAESTKAKHLFQVRTGDFIYNRLFAWKGSFGVIPESLDGCFVSGEFPLFETDRSRLVPEYLWLWMSRPSIWTQIERESTGSTTVSRNRWKEERLLALSVPLPSIAVQQRIIDLDLAVRECYERATELTEAVTDARAAVESAINVESCETVPLGAIADVVSGVTKDAKRQGDPGFVEVPYLRVANVQRGFLDLDDLGTIRVPPAKAEQLRLVPGDVLFNEGGDRDKLGRGWIWEGQVDHCIHQNHVLRARLHDARFEPRFVSIWGNTFGRDWFEIMGSQTTNLASLNLSTLKTFPVPVVPLDLQRDLVETSAALSAVGSSAAIEARRVLDVRASVVEDLLAGAREISGDADAGGSS